MSDLIDRNEVIKKLEQLDSQDLYLPLHFLDMVINEVSVVDAELVRHERWIQPDQRKGYRCCSGCKNGGIWVDVPLPKFCGECGAKMDKEEQDGYVKKKNLR